MPAQLVLIYYFGVPARFIYKRWAQLIKMDKEATFNPSGQLIIDDYSAWMDGGTITLKTRDKEFKKFEIEFVQKVDLKKRDYSPYPGSVLLDRKEIEIRSDLEKKILTAVQAAEIDSKISEKKILKKMINECIEFVTSDKYLEVARKVGRLN